MFKKSCDFFLFLSFRNFLSIRSQGYMSRAILPTTLDLSSISFLSAPKIKTRALTPLSSPPRTPISTSPTGFLDRAKQTLETAIRKQNTKASNTSIDEYVQEVVEEYKVLSLGEKKEFLSYMAKYLATDHRNVAQIVKQMPSYQANSSESSRNDLETFIKWEDQLRACFQPPYYWLMMQISRLPGGVKFIIDLRADLLDTIASQTQSRTLLTQLKAFDGCARDLLSLWFTVGMLGLQRITWESSCEMLEKISNYEAVHPMRNWTDLKNRVGYYRRCFVFTHHCIPDEPLVVLHTYLTNSITESMTKVVRKNRSASIGGETSSKTSESSLLITTAIFYSITSTQKGLRGIELGNYLIKRVVKELQSELPHLSQFSSLSPIPGFMKWLQNNVLRAHKGELNLFTDNELNELKKIFCIEDRDEIYLEFRRLLLANAWVREEYLKNFCEKPMMRLAAYYLFSEKRRGYALCPVANFHLRNGAVMWRLNWNADTTPRGLDNSGGIMVNYRYFIENCEKSSKAYLENQRISASENIVYLAKVASNMMEQNVSIQIPVPPLSK